MTFTKRTCILIGLLCLITIGLHKKKSTFPKVDLFSNIHSGADKKQFVEEAVYFSLDKTALSQIHQQKHETMTLQIPFGATKKLDVTLNKTNFFSNNFKVTTQLEDSHNTLSYSPGLFYKGSISGVKDALVVINFFRESMTGVLSLNGNNYNIGPFGENDSDTYVLYKERNLNASNPFACSTEDPKEITINRIPHQSNARSKKTVEVYVECDYALFVAEGASVQKTVDFASGLFTVVSSIYANEDIDLQVSEIKVWTEQDPYPTTSAKAARDAFGESLNGNFNGDIAHLLSNYKKNGTVPKWWSSTY